MSQKRIQTSEPPLRVGSEPPSLVPNLQHHRRDLHRRAACEPLGHGRVIYGLDATLHPRDAEGRQHAISVMGTCEPHGIVSIVARDQMFECDKAAAKALVRPPSMVARNIVALSHEVID